MADGQVEATGSQPPADPVDVYKKHVDLTLIRQQLRRTPDERAERMIAALRLAEELRTAGRRDRR